MYHFDPQLNQSDPEPVSSLSHETNVNIIVLLNDCINYASWQNAVPFLKSLIIQNQSDQPLTNLVLEMVTEPALTRPKRWVIQQIDPGIDYEVPDRFIEIDAGYLNALNEAERGQVKFALRQGEKVLSTQLNEIRILARDQWGGLASMAELLAAFVMPNDPAIAGIMRKTGRTLSDHGHSSALDGYQSGDSRRSYLLTAAIWSAMAEANLTYASPPRSFETEGQKIRRPSTIMADRLGTCLDTTLMFASVIEAIGLNPIVIFQKGHCFVGAWLKEKSFATLIELDVTEIRKAIAARELVIFETTLITGVAPSGFEEARAAAEASISPAREANYVAAIDIDRARMSQIRPLASHSVTENAQKTSLENARSRVSLSEMPEFGPEFSETLEDKPSTPAGRVERWQRKLLDLSLRNRLLNFRSGKQSIPFICPDVPQLEDRLASGSKLRIVSLMEQNPLGERDKSIHFQKTHKDLDIEFARAAFSRGELAARLDQRELSTRLTDLYRKAKNDLAEGGSNTLYLAVGFLRWKRKQEDSNYYLAPLLLVPVKLLRTSAVAPFQLAHYEDEVRFNATLIQMLKKDFERDLTHFESELPRDDNGIDVVQVMERMRRAVRDLPGFEVVDETALATFSFAKYLMWKDMVDRLPELPRNRVVRHLIQDPDKAFESGASSPFPTSQDIDRKYEPHQLVHPLPADSSQLAAIAAVREGHDFVLIGPPGTGKSQTITNMIAQCLADRKTVLFVAEKTAALDVVYRRLREHGLGDYCLELHSNKAERRKFLDQMNASWSASQTTRTDQWLKINERLKFRRDELNRYVEEIHKLHANGWSVFRAMGVSVKGSGCDSPDLQWSRSQQHDTSTYQSFIQLIREMSITHQAMGGTFPPKFLKAKEWSALWETDLFRECELLEQTARFLQAQLQTYATSIGMPCPQDCTLEELERFNRVAKAMIATRGNDYRVLFNKQFAEMTTGLDDLIRATTAYQSAKSQLKANYDSDSLKRMPVEDLDRAWREANVKFWPLSIFAKRKVQKLIQSYASQGMADPQNDLPKIRIMQLEFERISGNLITSQPQLWQGIDTDIEKLRNHIAIAREARQAIVDLGKSHGNVADISSRLYPAISAESSDHPILLQSQAFIEATERFSTCLQRFNSLAGASPVKKSSTGIFNDLFESLKKIKENRPLLQRWIAWSGVRQKAEASGLNSFINALEQGGVEPHKLESVFELAYVRWWLPGAIDQSQTLRGFQKFKHEQAIRDFQKLDQLARQEASSHVHNALVQNLPSPDQVPRQSELGLLRHQMQLQRPSKTIREVIEAMPGSFTKLAPCLLMSPLSIAQYLPSNQALFDVVIFDEASQITTWDAIGAIARGRQTVIVGDPKQLPPTNFFGRADNDDQSEEIEDHERDLESILDEAKASGLPTLQLNWHYRSSHESLIAFSNTNYYDNQLITFPSAMTNDRAVMLKYLNHGKYDRGKTRTNRQEAEAIVADAVARMKEWLNLPEEERLTLGVITFNSQQQSLVQDLFDEAQRQNPEIEWFFNDARIEPTVVKNLENVQGDERDCMLFSVAFGPDSSGKLPLVFGALNRSGGERRLNVAVTRARRELVVYASFKADQLNAEKTNSIGVKHLKNFLDYADRGVAALEINQLSPSARLDSVLEEAVVANLSAKGWKVATQIGASGFRVDIAVVNPDDPETYLAGIECDGATYQKSATARDRDKIREEVLKHLGWSIIRIWTPDWWYDSEGASKQVHKAICDLLEARRKAVKSKANEPVSDDTDQTVHKNSDAIPLKSVVPLESIAIDAESFFDFDYSINLRNLIIAVLQAESPIRDDLLVQRVARLHNFLRTGNRIRDRVLNLIDDVTYTQESTGRFLWSSNEPLEMTEFRHPKSDEERRSVDQISLAELCGLIMSNRIDLTESDPALAIARRLGIGRLTSSGRERIQEGIERAKVLLVKS